MPQYSETIRRGGYNPFGLTRDYHLDVLGRSLDKMDERHQKALEQATAIDLALGKVELNAAEDAWKANYINNIRKEIDNAAQFGNYSTALSTATKLAGKALSDPGLLGRVRANAAYEEAKKQVLARNDINQVTKDRWLAQNKYSYNDIVDDNGNVVGGSEWNPDWRPVSRYDMANLYGLVKQLAAEEAGGGESAQFLDENGNLTSDMSKGFYGMAVKRGSRWERLSEDKLRNVFNALFKQAPEAMDSLMQDMNDRHWQYDNADDEGKKAFIGSDIMDSSGHMYTPQEYLEHRINPVLKEMAYNRVHSTMDFGSAYANKLKADRDKATRTNLLSMSQLGKAQAFTTPIEVKLNNMAGNSFATVNDALKNVSSVIPNSVITNALSTGDYGNLADYATSVASRMPNGNPLKAKLLANVDVIRTEGERLNNLTQGFTDEEKQAFRTKHAIEAGIPMTDARTNAYTREYSKRVDDLFSYRDEHGKKHQLDKIQLQFKSSADLDNLKNKLGLTDKQLQDSGVTVRTLMGTPTLEISRKSGLIRAIASNAGDNVEIRYEDNGIGRTDYTNVVRKTVDKPSFWDIFKKTPLGTGQSTTTQLASPVNSNLLPNFGGTENKLKAVASGNSLEKNLDNIIEKAFKKANVSSTVPLTVLPSDDHTTLMLNEAWINGMIEDGQYKEMYKQFNDNNLKQVGFAMAHPGNLSIYAPDQSGEVARLLEQGDKRINEIANDILVGLAEDRVEIAPANPNTPAGYGTIIRIAPKTDSKGNEVQPGYTVYADGLLHSPAAEAMVNDPARRMRNEFEKDRASNMPINDVNGNRIDYNAPNALDQYTLSREISDLRTTVKVARASGEDITDEQISNVLDGVLLQHGYNPDSNAYKEQKAKLYYELINE